MMRSITATAILSVVMLSGAPVAMGESVTGATAINVAPVPRSVTIPAGTVLRLRLDRGFGSDISRVEDSVIATLASPVVINGRTLLPTGSVASGYVSEATRPGKVVTRRGSGS